jgi:glucosamine-phosphate N-acetyltransferase
MNIREACYDDFHKGHLELLSQLSITNLNITHEEYIAQSDLMEDIIVIEEDNRIVGSATMWVEYKLTHSLGRVCHIEDVIVDVNKRGRGYGKALIEYIVGLAGELKCYKVILNCDPDKCEFYSKMGFVGKDVGMILRL